MGADHQLAQLNVARMVAPLDSPELAGFVDGLERINALADRADGFVWRLQSDEGDATAFRPFGPEILVNISVWRDVDALKAYVYRSEHVEFVRRRTDWFLPMDEAHAVLWWVPAGHRPTESEALERLERLRADGPSDEAFTFQARFPPPSG